MFFWNINALVHKLKTFTLTAYEQAQYYLAMMLCFSLTSLVQLMPHQNPLDTRTILVTWAAGLVVLFCGIAYCYKINKSGDNKDFMLRMMSLMFTGALRFAAFSLLAIIPLSILVGLLIGMYVTPETMQQNANVASVIGGAFGLIWAAGLYWYVGKQFKKIAEHTQVTTH